MSAGWMPCDNPRRHSEHEWVYRDPNTGLAIVATCDGGQIRTKPERQCCADPLCPCATKPGWSTDAAAAMNYPDLNDPDVTEIP